LPVGFNNDKEREMTLSKQEKEQLVKDFIGTVQESLLEKIDRVPEEWDGHELRTWIADAFNWQRSRAMEDKKRLKKYKNDVLTNNL
jgi:hypothetical protein